MKINEMIRKGRLEKNMTQEQFASCLGVTAPAVNKWEKGSSYPDITLLPPLARLIGTDLNTLLSFEENLTRQEIGSFLNELSETSEKKGFERTYQKALDKIKEYPSCDELIINTALFLDGLLVMEGKKENEVYKEKIEALYERALNSKEINVKCCAQSVLVSKYIEKKDYERAEAMIEAMPDKTAADKKQLKINLLIKKGMYSEAARLEEEKLMSAVGEINSMLITLMEIALKENREDDAEYIAGAAQKSSVLFDLGEYQSYAALFQLYYIKKKRLQCLKALVPMLKSLTRPWRINDSPLYRHIKTKTPEKGVGLKFGKSLLQTIFDDENSDFLKDSPELNRIKREIDEASEFNGPI